MQFQRISTWQTTVSNPFRDVMFWSFDSPGAPTDCDEEMKLKRAEREAELAAERQRELGRRKEEEAKRRQAKMDEKDRRKRDEDK